jgi:hypothetical protein
MKTWDEWMKLHRNRIESGNIKTEKTFIILGCKRGGTSMLAGVLRLLGINMGENMDDIGSHEDRDLTDRNLEDMIQTIQEKNCMHKVWGWKDPLAIDYIYQLMPFLINPVFLIIFRDPCAIANSEVMKHNKNFQSSFWEAMNQIKKLHYFSLYPDKYINGNNGSVYVLSYEKSLIDPENTFKELCSLLKMEFNPTILEFVAPGYRNLPKEVT